MARGPSFDDLRSSLIDQYDVLVAGLAALAPEGRTDCAGWTVADLETHVALTAQSLARLALDQEAATGPGPVDGMDAWAGRLPGLAARLDAAARGERLSLAPQAESVATALAALAPGDPGDRVVGQLTGRHTLRDATAFRLVETVVHGLDVDVTPHPAALKLVVKELARTLADRHPGKTVEVRVPPYAAVQCLSGPRHTRGTPPNVVEAQPVAFVRLCAGRERWADVVSDGRVRASGERSDLSALLPLLG